MMPEPRHTLTQPIRVLIAEDERLLCSAIAELLPQVGGAAVAVVSTCATRRQLLHDTRTLRPDVVLLDLRMPDQVGAPCTLGGPETIAALRRQWAAVRIICLSVHAEPTLVRACLDAGAMGFLGKGILPRTLWAGIRTVVAGAPAIDPALAEALARAGAQAPEPLLAKLLAGRRGDVLHLLLAGCSRAEIAATLPIGKKYVDKKIAEIKTLLDVDTTLRIYRRCRQLGIVDD